MRRALWLVPILLSIGGRYLPPATSDYGYAQPGYAQPEYPPTAYAPQEYAPQGYAAPGYPPQGYPQPGYDPYAGYPGYSYNDGAPVFYDSGAAVPLVFFGGGWGYYDHDRQWHRAPEGISRDLSARRDGGGDFHPNGPGRPQASPQGRPPGGDQYRGQPQANQQQGFHPAAQPWEFHPGGQPQRPIPPVGVPQPRQGQPQPQARQQEQPRQQEQHRGCDPNQRC